MLVSMLGVRRTNEQVFALRSVSDESVDVGGMVRLVLG